MQDSNAPTSIVALYKYEIKFQFPRGGLFKERVLFRLDC